MAGQPVVGGDAVTDAEDNVSLELSLLRARVAELERFERIVDALPFGAVVLQVQSNAPGDLRFAYANARAGVESRLDVRSHIGRTLEEVLPDEFREEGEGAEPAYVAAFRRAAAGGVAEVLDVDRGPRGWLDLHCIPLGDGCVAAVYHNTSARKQVEGALRASEASLRQLADAMPQIVWTAEPDGSLDYYNQRWFDYTGMSLEQTVSWGWGPVLHPDDRKPCVDLWKKAIATGEPYEIRYRFKRASDGCYRWHLGRAFASRDAQGGVTKWFGTCTDIEDQVQIEQALRASEASLTTTLDSIGDGMIATDDAGRVLRMNPVAVRLTGWTLEDALGRPLSDVFRIISEATRETVESPVERVLREGVVVGLANHTALVSKDGAECPIADSGAPIRDAQGNVNGVVLVFHDMTTERASERLLLQSEARFRRLLDSGIIGILVADLAGNILHANDAFLEMAGYTRDDLGAGLVRWVDMTPPEWAAGDQVAVGQLRAVGVVTPYEKEYFRKDGSRFPIVLGAAMIEGEQAECICFVLDLTERKRAEQAVLLLNAELERRVEQRTHELADANRELEAFSYSVAHDLRAPLRGIGGFAQVLAEDYADKLDAEGQDCLREIHTNADRMAQLIDALLLLARVSRSEMRRETVDLASLVRSVAASLARTEPRPTLDLTISGDLRVEMDPSLAQILVENLLGNAWKFTRDASTPRIEIGCTDDADARIVHVRDNGAGFDMTYKDKLFTPFQRLHTTAEFPGTGIGLATTQRIVKRHGGQIWAESVVGQGATFYFRLPISETEKTTGGSR